MSIELLALLATAGIGVVQTAVLVEIARRQGHATAERESHADRLDRQGDRMDRLAGRLDRLAEQVQEVVS